MEASIENLKKDIYGLDAFNATPGKGTTRIVFTEEEVRARTYIKSRMKETGLKVEEDAIGNIFGILEGTEPELAPVWSGSHIDTVKNAGMFDGMAGVVAAVEALRMIKESGMKFRRSIKAIVYTSEEPTRFGVCCLGSRAMAGELTYNDLVLLKDENNRSLKEVLKDLKFNLDEFSYIKRQQGDIHASVELHIEQGAVLEQKGLPIGIVKGICGPTALMLKIKGTQEHAGSTPMAIRKDAMAAAAEIVLRLEELVKKTESEHTVGTVGYVDVYPNVTNAIPGEVNLSIDLRDIYMETKESVLEDLYQFFDELEAKREIKISYEVLNHDKPVMSNERINDCIEQICMEHNIKYHKMVSGAYHDSMFVGKFAPMSMIFVPSKAGLSHNPEEWTEFEDLKLGTEVLAGTLLELAK